MTPLFLLIASVHLVGIAIIVLATFRAPFGYEDKNGFHPTHEPESDQSKAGSP